MKFGDMVLCEDGVERRYLCDADGGYVYVECDKTFPEWIVLSELGAAYLFKYHEIDVAPGTIITSIRLADVQPAGATCIRCNEFAPYQPTDSNFACWQCREHHAWEVAIIRSKK